LALCYERGILFNVIKDLIKMEELALVKDFIKPERMRKKSEETLKEGFQNYISSDSTILQFANV